MEPSSELAAESNSNSKLTKKNDSSDTADNVTLSNEEVSRSQCSISDNSNTSADQQMLNRGGDIEWDKSMQGWILSSYFYGYVLTQIPFGYLSGRFGGKRILLIGMFIYGASTIALPFFIRIDLDNPQTGAVAAIVLRIIAGMASGCVSPSVQTLWGKWAPPYERSKLNVLSMSGSMIGNVLVLGVGGFLCEWKEFDGGWPSIFYISGALCLLFCIMWALIVYDSPLEHPRISQKEKDYIINSMAGIEMTKNTSVPWRGILSSRAVWALIVTHVCSNFGDYTLVTKLPAYMKEVLGFEIVSNGLYSVLPYIASFVVANTASNIIDTLRKKRLMSTTAARKLAMTVALMVPGGILVAVGHIPCNLNYLAVVFLTIAVGCTGFDSSGYKVNAQDIAAKYAGEIFSISNTFAIIPGMVTPPLVNYMTIKGTQDEWQIVFYVWAGVYCFGAIFYLIFASGEPQQWSQVSKGEEKDIAIDEKLAEDIL